MSPHLSKIQNPVITQELPTPNGTLTITLNEEVPDQGPGIRIKNAETGFEARVSYTALADMLKIILSSEVHNGRGERTKGK